MVRSYMHGLEMLSSLMPVRAAHIRILPDLAVQIYSSCRVSPQGDAARTWLHES